MFNNYVLYVFIYLSLGISKGGYGSIIVSTNKIWPIHNAIETYRYYDFPFCQPEQIVQRDMSLGQILRGDRLTSSVYGGFNIAENRTDVDICSKNFSSSDISRLSDAIKDDYVYEIIIGDKSVVVPFGNHPIPEVDNLCTHLQFELSSGMGTTVESATTSCKEYVNVHRLTATTPPVEFSYSVVWVPPKNSTGQSPKSQGAIHWMSIVNSFILTIMIVGLVAIVLIKVVRADLLVPDKSFGSSKLELGGEDENSAIIGEESALWKLLHGDVFRPPVHRMWLCAAAGSGVQLLFVVGTVGILGTIWTFIRTDGAFQQRGALITAAVVIYLLSAAISGYVSSRMYVRIGGF
jgi:hypothetical protein